MYRDEDDGILDEGYIVKEGSEDEARSFLVNTVKHQKIPIKIGEVDQSGPPQNFAQEYE